MHFYKYIYHLLYYIYLIILISNTKLISKSSSSTIRINQGEKRTISESMGDKTNDGGRSVFMKYKINEKEKNNESPQFKSKSISQINNVNSNNDKNIKILPENNKKEEENKLESSGYDEFVS